MFRRITGVICLATFLAVPAIAAVRDTRAPNEGRDLAPIERMIQKIVRRVIHVFGDWPIVPPPAPNP